MPFKIVRNDITKMTTEAIVNTAMAATGVGAGCDSAVYKAAGYDRLLEYRRQNIGDVNEGDVFITPGFDLAAKYIIHAVSPLYKDGESGEEEKLRACYRRSLELARERGIRSVAFPLISTGSFGYPKEEGMRIAVDEINAFLLTGDMEIYLVVFDTRTTMLGERICPDLETYIDQNYVKQARKEEYGSAYLRPNASFRRADSRPGAARKAAKQSPPIEQFLKGANFCKPMANSSAQDDELRDLFDAAPSPGEREEQAFTASNEFDYDKHETKLEERMRHMSDTFSEYLMYLIQAKNLENAEVWKRGIVDKKVFSKIKMNPNYHPTKLTAMCLCVGATLNLDETRDLLARAGYALSPCDKTDIIFSYFIENGIYDMIELDIQLEEHGLPCVIA